MKKLEYVWVDVFSDKPYSGNQLAVFPDGGELEPAEMQLIAREMSLSESTFVTDSHIDEKGNQICSTRIFTIDEELPFAGHPSLGTAFVMGQMHGRNRIILDLKVGNIPVNLESRDNSVFAEMTQNDPVFGSVHDPERIADAFGLNVSEIDTSIPIQTVSTGLPFIMVPFSKLETLENLEPDFSKMSTYLDGADGKFFYTVSRETKQKGSVLHARMFFYGGEDPGTGSAAGPAAAWLIKYGVLEPDTHAVIEQGMEIKRQCDIYVKGSLKGTVPINIRVGGYCSMVGKGTLEI